MGLVGVHFQDGCRWVGLVGLEMICARLLFLEWASWDWLWGERCQA